MKYLRIPISTNRLGIQAFNGIVDKIRKARPLEGQVPILGRETDPNQLISKQHANLCYGDVPPSRKNSPTNG